MGFGKFGYFWVFWVLLVSWILLVLATGFNQEPTRTILGHTSLKISILGCWHLVIQYLMLIMKIASFWGFGNPGRHKKHLKIGKLEFCTFVTSPLAALVSRNFCQAGQCSQWAGRKGAKIQFCDFQMPPMPSKSPKSQKGGHFCDQHQILHK